MDELNERLYEITERLTEDKTEIDVRSLAEEIGKQIVKILIETGLLGQN